MKNKTFKEKTQEIKKNCYFRDAERIIINSLPEDFSEINEKQLMYLWHFLSDSLIGDLYAIPKSEVKKKREEFNINPITSAFDAVINEDYKDSEQKK